MFGKLDKFGSSAGNGLPSDTGIRLKNSLNTWPFSFLTPIQSPLRSMPGRGAGTPLKVACPNEVEHTSVKRLPSTEVPLKFTTLVLSAEPTDRIKFVFANV